MSKKNLIQSISNATGITKVEAERAIDFFVAGLGAELQEGRDVRLAGVGTFSVARRNVRRGTNFQGEAYEIPAHYVVKFKASPNLNEAVN